MGEPKRNAATDMLKMVATKMTGLLTDKKSRSPKSLAAGAIYDGSSSSYPTGSPQVIAVEFNPGDRLLHHVELFAMPQSAIPTQIFRRGEVFTINLTFNVPFNSDFYELYLIFAYGPSASVEPGTLQLLSVARADSGTRDSWACWVTSFSGANVTVSVVSPPTCQVGVWRYGFEVGQNGVPPAVEPAGTDSGLIYILFNPWNRRDEVFMESENLLRQCVVADHGVIYAGSKNSVLPKAWVYGQFDYVVLPTVALLLEHSRLPHEQRGSAALVARALSAVMNGNDDAGLLDGNWSYGPNQFPAGTNDPNSWTGSLAIFERYLETEGEKPVEYGQCVQFAGCLTTACRAIGLPCRTVTCFDAAKDMGKDLSVDFYFDRRMERVNTRPGLPLDRVWNYHCWNEVWMARPDLGGGMDGWQAIDATPQGFLSDYLSQVGPAPIKAVREGDVKVKYDVDTVFMEVSADCRVYYEDPNSPGNFNLVSIDIGRVGTLIVTEHNNEIEILTAYYKYDKATVKGKQVYLRALELKGLDPNVYSKAVILSGAKDVNYFLQCKPPRLVTYGQPFLINLTLSIQDRRADRTVDVKIQAYSTLYTGQTDDVLKESHVKISLQAAQPSQTVSLPVSFAEYRSKVKSSSSIKIIVFGAVSETQQTFHTEYVLHLQFPELSVVAPTPLRVGRESALTVSFRNTAGETLTGVRLRYEGPGISRPKYETLPDIPPGHLMEKVVKVVPWRPGHGLFVSHLSSDQFAGVQGSRHFLIGEN